MAWWIVDLAMAEETKLEVAVLNAALELPVGQRAAYLDQACAGDAALRQAGGGPAPGP